MHFIIKRKVLITMLFTGLTMLGVFSYRQLPVELFPNTQIPYLFVQVGTSMEMDPEYIENQAIIPIEGAIGTLKGSGKDRIYRGPAAGFYPDILQAKYRYQICLPEIAGEN